MNDLAVVVPTYETDQNEKRTFHILVHCVSAVHKYLRTHCGISYQELTEHMSVMLVDNGTISLESDSPFVI